MHIKNLSWLIVSLITIVCDQWSKQLAVNTLTLYQPKPLIPFINLTLAHNTGAAFSLLGAAGGWQRWFFAFIAVFASVICIIWLLRLPAKDRISALAISLVLGGALGNLWDRLVYGYVIDFIDFYVNDWHWPVFNIADSAICMGVALLIMTTMRKQEY